MIVMNELFCGFTVKWNVKIFEEQNIVIIYKMWKYVSWMSDMLNFVSSLALVDKQYRNQRAHYHSS